MEKALELRERIVEIVKAKGPVLPVQISKEIGSDILMASAHLAELTASQRLKISTIKVGGSPLYYLSGQESMLQKFTGNMNDKEKKAFDLLSQQKVLRDSEQEPVIRVALREIKDFAIPLNVTHDGNREVFWKWYLAPNDEAEGIIKSKLDILEKPVEKKIEEKKPEVQKQVMKEKIEQRAEPVQKQAIKEKTEAKTEVPQKEAKKYKPREKDDIFLKDIMKFFEKNKVSIISSEIIKKNSEIDFIVQIPSVVGNLQYYCKARNKKKISDSDLSNAYVKGQLKRLPVIVLSPGELSAKANEMIGKELNNLTFKKI
ncbi:hypothetical protein HY487_01435 [Candidatus Woesearchaeota archaeon]|nr:hypothetical protein [Candidatus Woesearchaeota archaeon]